MKTTIFSKSNAKIQESESMNFLSGYKIIIAGFLLLFLSSCQKEYWGYDGFDGKAFIALSWTDSEPDYIDPGTNAIPSNFYWDDYYRIHPGIYTLYYDGVVGTRNGWVEYAWEVDYEIWINYGEPGSRFYDGMDGLDNYFVLECNPYGPDIFLDLKSKSLNSNYKIISSTDDMKVVLTENEYFSMKATYRKVEKRTHAQL